MTTEQPVPNADSVAVMGPADVVPLDGDDYWHRLIAEKPAADFLDVTPRKMQQMRQHGDGPPYVRLCARCIKYTRVRLKKYADERLRTSTADPGPEDTE